MSQNLLEEIEGLEALFKEAFTAVPPSGGQPQQGMPPQQGPPPQGMPPQGMPPQQGPPPQGGGMEGMDPQAIIAAAQAGDPQAIAMVQQAQAEAQGGGPPQGGPPQGGPPQGGPPPQEGGQGLPPELTMLLQNMQHKLESLEEKVKHDDETRKLREKVISSQTTLGQ